MNLRIPKPTPFSFLLIILVWGVVLPSYSAVSICSWNLQDLGQSKDEQEIDYIASVIVQYDIIAIQEVVAGVGGAQAVARLVDAMNRKGKSWDYTISDPTRSSSYKTERYAYIWNKKTVSRIGDGWLDNQYAIEIDREPYFATFKKEGKDFTLVNFHAITKSKQPETEIKYFKLFPTLYPNLKLIFCGDFNCPQSHTVFNPLKSMGYTPVFTGQKTSLRVTCIQNDCLASEFDNIFYHKNNQTLIDSGVIHFYRDFASMEEARKISDHVPIYAVFSL